MSARKLVALAAAALGALAGAGDAVASTAGTSGGSIVFSAAAGENNDVSIVLEAGAYRVSDAGAAALTALTGCNPTGDPRVVTCSAAGITSISAGTDDGNDRFLVDAPAKALVLGGTGADTIVGGAGDDTLLGMDGADTVRGGAGRDLLFELDDQRNVLDGGPGADSLSGGDGPDQVLGAAGDDVRLFGGEGDDLIDGGEGADVLNTGGGPSPGSSDSDRLVGGPGADTASYAARGDPVRVSLADGANDGAPDERDDVAGDIERLDGSQSNDELSGGPSADVIDGRGGDDIVDGGAGADRLDGGRDDAAGDTLRGGAGDDLLEGRDGTDKLEGGADSDRLAGDASRDILDGGEGRDLLSGGAGDDELDGGTDADELTGGAGIDTVRYGDRGRSVQVTLDGEANDGEVDPRGGRTRIEEGASSAEGDNVDDTNERVTATQADDTVTGDARPNDLSGSAGEDYLEGGRGADVLSGGGRSDGILSRDGARDRVTCGAGYDYVVADRRDLVSRRAAKCEYIDDGSRSRPMVREDVALDPRCGPRRDAELLPPGSSRGVPVDQRVLAPLGSRVDAFDCAVRLSVGIGGGRTASGVLGRKTGALRVEQRVTPGGRAVTRMRPTDCRPPAGAARVEASPARFRKRRYRRKYGNIAFPAEVRVDAALITKLSGVATWTVNDRCGRSATISVDSGRLAVLDLGRDRRVLLGPGQTHTAVAR